jgi:putative FmdB family regulatory protein
MPIYEYRCRDCGAQIEVLVRSGAQEPQCSECGSSLLDKLFSAPYVMSQRSRPSGRTCCGQQERCEAPPCSAQETCWRG